MLVYLFLSIESHRLVYKQGRRNSYSDPLPRLDRFHPTPGPAHSKRSYPHRKELGDGPARDGDRSGRRWLPTSAGRGDASKEQTASVLSGTVWDPPWSADVSEHELGRAAVYPVL